MAFLNVRKRYDSYTINKNNVTCNATTSWLISVASLTILPSFVSSVISLQRCQLQERPLQDGHLQRHHVSLVRPRWLNGRPSEPDLNVLGSNPTRNRALSHRFFSLKTTTKELTQPVGNKRILKLEFWVEAAQITIASFFSLA